MSIVTDKYRGTGEYFLVFNELVKAAKYRGIVTYQELASLIGLPVVGAYMGSEIGHILGEISAQKPWVNLAAKQIKSVNSGKVR